MFTIVLTLSMVFAIPLSASAVRYMNIATSRMGGSFYPAGETIARVVMKYVPGVKMNATTASGSYERIGLLRKKQADLSFMLHDCGYRAYNGLSEFKGKAYKDLRIIFNIPKSPLHVIALTKSGIKRFEDIKGKVIGESDGSTSLPDAINSLFEVYGMSRKDCTFKALGRRDRAQALVDGNTDVNFHLISEGSATIVELVTLHDITFVKLDMEKLQQIHKKRPYWLPGAIDKKYYPKTLKADYETIYNPGSICVDASMPEGLVYSMVKAVWDHHDEMIEMNKYFKRIKKEEAILATADIPIHPGAERYFREVGLLK